MEPLKIRVSIPAMERTKFTRCFLRALAVIFTTLLCGCEDRSRTARDAAEEMARLFSGRRFAEAYGQVSVAFRFTRSAEYFEARVRDLGLCDARGVQWGEAVRSGRMTSVRGEFTLKDGGKLALNFTFGRENGGWRLIEARTDPTVAGGRTEDVFAVAARSKDTMAIRAMDILEPNALAVPAEPQLRQLAEDTLLLFSDATRNGGDFTALYESASDRWKYRGREQRELTYAGPNPALAAKMDLYNNDNRLTVAALSKAFATAVEAKVDLSSIRGKKMILSEPARVNSDGVLNLSGTFDAFVFQADAPGELRKLEFDLEYTNEAGLWKLLGLSVHLLITERPPAAKP